MRAILALIITFCCCISVYAQEGFMWRPSTISLSLERDDKFLRIGQYLHLKNNLKNGEYGWSEMKIDLPDTWKIVGLKFDGDAIVFSNQQKEKFRIAPPKLNDMDLEILNGGDKSDREMERIWRKYAKTRG